MTMSKRTKKNSRKNKREKREEVEKIKRGAEWQMCFLLMQEEI